MPWRQAVVQQDPPAHFAAAFTDRVSARRFTAYGQAGARSGIAAHCLHLVFVSSRDKFAHNVDADVSET